MDTPDLCRQLAGSGIVLLPSLHAARIVRARLPVTESPAPLAWSEWTALLWSNLLLQGADDRLLLNRLQEQKLWDDLLELHPPAEKLSERASHELARLARTALEIAESHRVLDRLRGTADTPDARFFAVWYGHFRERCQRDRLLAPALLEDALAAHLESGDLAPPSAIHLVGFEQILPAQTFLLDRLRGLGTFVQHHTLRAEPAETGGRLSAIFPDPPTQLRAAVRLAASYASAHGGAAPHRIALVVPDPERHRPALERLFRQILAPELEPVTADLSSTPWHFTHGAPLAQVPVVAHALALLQWMVSPLPIEQVSLLLHSPFFASSDTPEARARFDWELLRRGPLLRGTVSLEAFAELSQLSSIRNGLENTARFAEITTLASTAADLRRRAGQRSPAEWADNLRRFLQLAGWPGNRALSPAEFRAVQAWETLLDQLATLSFDGSRMGIGAFLELLLREAGSMPLPPSFVNAPIQVLSLPETDGLVFDLVLHLDANDRNLPAVERRHPLLPQGLQKALGVGDPAAAAVRARRALTSLADRSSALYLFVAQNGVDAEAQLTRLGHQLGFHSMEGNAVSALGLHEPGTFPVQTEAVIDAATLPLQTQIEVGGGVDVLRLQAACGFQAFATHRLRAAHGANVEFGLDARERGTLLHAVLQALWQQLGNQQALKSLTEQQRRTLVETCVAEAFDRKHLRAKHDDAWTTHFLQVAKRRFANVIGGWLQLELQRSPFVVQAQEAKQELTLGPLKLSVRLDRIDLVGDRLVLVDYKTSGNLSVKQWLDSRPEAPQLPAYALCAQDSPLEGIAFARVRPGKMQWISLSENTGVFPRSGDNRVEMARQLEQWREELHTLASSFAAGDARVNPRDHPKTCNLCAHRALCRLDPTTLLANETEADAEEGSDLV